jgi:glycosyltransferase involved in cell wall biosynthesis
MPITNAKKVIILGSAHPLRGGGLATFNHRLCKAFIDNGYEAFIVSFSLQYPNFLFPGSSQFTDEPAPEGVPIKTMVNSINPFNWIKVGLFLRKQKPDLIIVRYWLPFMGPCLGTILRFCNKHTKIICIADNVVPHEKRFGDKLFTKYFIKPIDGFITMSDKVFNDLKQFNKKQKPVLLEQHPLYDNFGKAITKEAACALLNINPNLPTALFFGFIRGYKGLDLLLEAMSKPAIINKNIQLIIAGEFYDEQEKYLALIKNSNNEANIHLHTSFIPDNEVYKYLSATDVVVQPYKNATQSGVTPLAYYFEKPMIVTNVGGLPQMVPHLKAGLVCEPNSQSVANAIEEFFKYPVDNFKNYLQEQKKILSWDNFITAILTLKSKL